MAKLDILEKIANNIQLDPLTDKVTVEGTNIVLRRDGAVPLDTTEIFFDKLSAVAYADGSLNPGKGKYVYGSKSYVGQHISVVDKTNGTVDMYQIQNTAGDLKKLLAEPLKGQEFDFDQYTLSEVLKQVIEALGGTVKQTPTA